MVTFLLDIHNMGIYCWQERNCLGHQSRKTIFPTNPLHWGSVTRLTHLPKEIIRPVETTYELQWFRHRLGSGGNDVPRGQPGKVKEDVLQMIVIFLYSFVRVGGRSGLLLGHGLAHWRSWGVWSAGLELRLSPAPVTNRYTYQLAADTPYPILYWMTIERHSISANPYLDCLVIVDQRRGCQLSSHDEILLSVFRSINLFLSISPYLWLYSLLVWL